MPMSTSRKKWIESLQLTYQPIGFTMGGAEIWAIIRALKQTKGNIRDAALLLRIGRSTLNRKLNDYNLTGKISGSCTTSSTYGFCAIVEKEQCRR